MSREGVVRTPPVLSRGTRSNHVPWNEHLWSLYPAPHVAASRVRLKGEARQIRWGYVPVPSDYSPEEGPCCEVANTLDSTLRGFFFWPKFNK